MIAWASVGQNVAFFFIFSSFFYAVFERGIAGYKKVSVVFVDLAF